MKIAITGGAGFIGNVLARRLKSAGHSVMLLDLQPSAEFPADSRIVDITDEAALTTALQGTDLVYHLAAEHRDDVHPIQKYYDVNVGGAEKLVRAAKANNIKSIIFTSSVAVYGLDAGDRHSGSRESDVPAPFNDYGASKLQSEKVFERWAREDAQHKLVTVRLVATFGPGNRGNIHTLIDQILAGRFIMIGSGHNRKSIAYVENVAAFLEFCKDMKPGAHLYNYTDKPDLSMRDLVGHIRKFGGMGGPGPRAPYIIGLLGGAVFDVAAKITGRNFPVSVIRIRKFCANTVVNSERAFAAGFTPPKTLAEGLEQMIHSDFAADKAAQKKAA